MKDLRSRRYGERGQTIVLIAVAMLALLAFAALAIDITALYIDRHQAQHAADAAALSAVKAIVASGYTSSSSLTSITAQILATNAAQSAAQQFTVGGTLVQFSDLTVTFPQFTNTNPAVSVVLTHTASPRFFARIWGTGSSTVRAKATAEAYNPSGGPLPIQVAGVRPWLLPNCDPTNTGPANPNCSGPFAYFVDPTDGHVVNTGTLSPIGKTITLRLSGGTASLQECSSSCSPYTTPTMQFYPLDIPENPPTPFCAPASQTSCGNSHGIYYDSIACFNPTTFTCGQTVNGPADPVWIDSRITTGSLKSRTDEGVQCLIHSTNNNPTVGCTARQYDQDCFTVGGAGNPTLISPGLSNPNPALANAQYISRSDSVVTVPLFDGHDLCIGGCSQINSATVVGFLQLGLQFSWGPGTGDVQAIIQNISGCNPGASSGAVTGGSVSPIPVRLIQAP